MKPTFRRFSFITLLIPALTACQAMTPGTFSAKGRSDSGSVTVSPNAEGNASDEEAPPAPGAMPDAPGKSPTSSTPPSADSGLPLSKMPYGLQPSDPIPIYAPSSAPGSPSGSASTKSPIGPLAKADDPMSPKADLGDPLGGGDSPPATKRSGCLIYHVEPSGKRVTAGVGAPYPPLAQPGRNTLQARFYAGILEAPLECETAACWTQTPVKPGHTVQMVVYLKGQSYYQTAMATDVGPDGANVEFTGPSIQDGDEIGFSHIPMSPPPFPAPVLTPMTDEAWYGSGVDCDFGHFTVKTASSDVRPVRMQRAKIAPRREY